MTTSEVIMYESAVLGLFVQADRFTGLLETWVGILESAIVVEHLWLAKFVLVLLMHPEEGHHRLHHYTPEGENNQRCKHRVLATHISYLTQYTCVPVILYNAGAGIMFFVQCWCRSGHGLR